jgi:PAS domain S-box-containing protein
MIVNEPPEPSLQEIRDRNATLDEHAIVAVTDPQGRITYVNDKFCAISKYTREELLGQDHRIINSGHHPNAFFRDMWATLAHHRVWHGEIKNRAKDGSYYWVDTTIKPFLNKQGRTHHYVAIRTDITARKCAEEDARIVRNQLQEVFDHSPAVLYALTLEGGTIVPYMVSENKTRLLGFTVAETLSYEWWLEQVHVDDRALAVASISETLAHGSSHTEYRLRHKNGAFRWVADDRRSVCNALTRSRELFGVWTDISDRKHADDALRASEQRYKALFEQAAVGVVQVDVRTGRYVDVNQRFCEITGRSRRELEQLTMAAITHPDDIDRGMEGMGKIRTGATREFTHEKRYVRNDRSEVWANVTISAMWPPGISPNYFIMVVQDVTAQKQLQEQYWQAQKMEAIGTLAGGIAHDFNNILMAINGYTALSEMILTENPEVRTHLGAVLKAASRATVLVRQILTVSRQQPLKRQPIQLAPVLAEALTLLRATIPSTIEFETAFPKNAPAVLADPTQVHQILMNLGTNAWHAMEGRTGRLKVTLERCVVDTTHAATHARLRPGVYACVTVSDTGSGMDQATLRRIFEPFFTTKPPDDGTGLGLAVVHSIMDSHEGAITVYSQPGEGTVFHLYFPVHGGDATLITAETGPAVRGRGERILFVDDEDLIVDVGHKALTALGYVVEITTQPAAALAMVRADPHRFALVITDQTMPRMTGLVFAGELQQLRPELPIILMTGNNNALKMGSAEAAGVRQILLKPFTIHSLGGAVHAALSPRSPDRNIWGSSPPY